MTEPTPLEVLTPTDRTTLRRKKDRGHFERELIYDILDEALIVHVGFGTEDSCFVTPMTFARIDDRLYLHGATGNRLLRQLEDGVPVCVTATLLDGLVLARSAFHHSMNYRSVMLFGTAVAVVDDDEKLRASAALLEHMAPGRSADARPPTDEELRATRILCVVIEEGSAKVRTGGPIDDDEDFELTHWAGEIPFMTVAGDPVVDGVLAPGTIEPSYVRAYPARGAPR
jgi:nitroimidazol reductase NimA-like FMN-containing flavoprotein (pyridoxamine 5'-phosphate oxidase superfamily)